MHMTSEDSSSLYPGNKPWCFYVVPPYPIDLHGHWVCSVEGLFCEVGQSFTQPLCFHVLVDCVSPCIAYGRQVRICATMNLRTLGESYIAHSTPIGSAGSRVDVDRVQRIKVELVKNSSLEHCEGIEKAVVVLRFSQK